MSAAPLLPLATSVSPVLSQQRAVAVMRYAFKAPRVLSQPLSCNVYRMCALAFHTRVNSASVIEEGIAGSGEAARRAGGTGRCAPLGGSVAASAARLLFCSGVSALASAHSGGCVHAVLFRGGVVRFWLVSPWVVLSKLGITCSYDRLVPGCFVLRSISLSRGCPVSPWAAYK